MKVNLKEAIEKATSAARPDGFPTIFLKECKKYLGQSTYMTMINASVKHHPNPLIWKPRYPKYRKALTSHLIWVCVFDLILN